MGCSKVFISLIYHLYNVRKSRADVRIVKKKTLEQPITKFTLAILVGFPSEIPVCVGLGGWGGVGGG